MSQTQRFQVTGMTCGHCEKAVIQAIQQVDADAQVRIDGAANLVEVQSAADAAALRAAIVEEGYETEILHG